MTASVYCGAGTSIDTSSVTTPPNVIVSSINLCQNRFMHHHNMYDYLGMSCTTLLLPANLIVWLQAQPLKFYSSKQVKGVILYAE